MLAGLGDPNWKVRLAAMEEVKSRLESAGSGVPGQSYPSRHLQLSLFPKTFAGQSFLPAIYR